MQITIVFQSEWMFIIEEKKNGHENWYDEHGTMVGSTYVFRCGAQYIGTVTAELTPGEARHLLAKILRAELTPRLYQSHARIRV